MERVLLVDMAAPIPETVRRWMANDFERTATMVRDKLSDSDQATLAVLMDATDPRGLMHRSDLALQAGRSLHVARKPA